MEPEIKNVFISHRSSDADELQNLKDLVAKQNYQLRDGSVVDAKDNNAKDPEYIKSQILAPGIQWASTLIVLISDKTHMSEWVEWEIEYAAKAGKRIVGVYAQGASGVEIPENLDRYADAVVGWQGPSIIDAIEGKINNWTNPDGSTREPRNIDRFGCN